MKISAGIDFGTTNTTAAITGLNTYPKVIPVEGNDCVIPSAMFFGENNNLIFFGRNAMKKYMDGDPGRFMRSLKRVLGTGLMKSGTSINGRPIGFQMVISAFLQNIKSKLDEAAGQNIDQVVMGRPVFFRDNDPVGDNRAEKELKQIAKDAGFKDILFQYEPIAAAFAHERLLKEEQLAAVIDIGGGTSDFTIIRLGGTCAKKIDRRQDILANTGIRIGGNDFDKRLSLETFMPEFGMGTEYNSGTLAQPKYLPVPTTYFFDLSEWSHVNSLYTYKNINMANRYWNGAGRDEKLGRLVEVMERQLGHKVLTRIEDAKIALSDQDEIKVPMDFLLSKTVLTATRKEFETSITEHTVKILDAAKECVKLANVKPEEIHLVVLTGGSTEIPFIRDKLCGVFPNAKISGEEKLSSVGLGLAFDAMRRF